MKLNYECHITLALKDAHLGKLVAEQFHWKTSQIHRDPVLGNDEFYYLTTHSDDIFALHRKMKTTTEVLMLRHGVAVLREKIELIIFDTKAR